MKTFRIINIMVSIAILSIGSMLFTGCASITRGTKEVLVVDSEPSNALVTLSNGMSGRTPATFRLKRKADVTVVIEKAGYETSRVQVTHQTAGGGAAGMAGNIVSFGIIGAGVDAMSGATQELTPNPLRVTLNPVTNVKKVAVTTVKSTTVAE